MINIYSIRKLLILLMLVLISFSCEKEKDEPIPPISKHFIQGEKEIFFYGSQHSNEPNDLMFIEIEDSFKSFIAEFVLIEGGYSNSEYQSRELAIKEGELAFVSYLASDFNIPKENIEPSDAHIDSILLLNYTDKQILSMYVLRQMCQYKGHYEDNPIDFSPTLTDFTNEIIKRGTLKIVDELTMDEILVMLNEISNLDITTENWRNLSLNKYLYDEENILNEIRNKVTDIRDEYAIDLIINSLNKYNKVFIIMGRQHLLNQEEELHKRIQTKF